MVVQWDFTRRDHPGNLGRVSGSGLVNIVMSHLSGSIFKKKNRVESPLFGELYPTYNLNNGIIITHPGSQQK